MGAGERDLIRILVLAASLAERAGLRALLSVDEDVEVVAETAALSELESMPANIDVLVSVAEAVTFPELGDFLAGVEPPLAMLMLTDQPQAAQELSELPTRAWGLLPLDTSEEELLAAVNALYEGLLVGTPALIQPLLGQAVLTYEDEDALVETLTDRESEVLELLAQGLANKQIALELGISEHTIKFHISSIYTKLGVTNRIEAVRLGVRLGLVVL
ncbi:MAG: response regulator transcription factor [Chloroflexi bacterium]|nr:response regulator transcription factor [Chloroflexota bacterium]